MRKPISRFYITGGTLPRDASSYVERKGDGVLVAELRAGEFCYVLTSRQMGKSSLMVRAVGRLREEGVICAVVDLTAIGQNLDTEHWYSGILNRLAEQLGQEEDLEEFWFSHTEVSPLLRLMRALREVVLQRRRERIVIFVDEIDIVRSLPFSADEFFAAIRACYNRRTEDPEFERLTFCLMGVASPTDLIRDTRMTPFNIGKRIDLTDFTPDEAHPLAMGLERANATQLLDRVLHWTGGHPYLTQRLCQAVQADPTVTRPRDVDRLCREIFFSEGARERNDNLLFVRDRMLRSELDAVSLLDAYKRALLGPPIRDDEASPVVSALRLAGIVRAHRGYLHPRNRIYAAVFNRAWIFENMPSEEVNRQRAAYVQGAVRAATVAALVLIALGALVAYLLFHRAIAKPVLSLSVAAARPTSIAAKSNYVYGGSTALFKVRLNTPAPAGGLNLSLSSTNSALTVPSNLMVAAGHDSAEFVASAHEPKLDQTSLVTAATGAGNAGSLVSTREIVKPVFHDFVVSPTRIYGGTTAKATLTIEDSALESGLEILLKSTSPSVSVPRSVRFASGQFRLSFPVTTTTRANGVVTINAKLGSAKRLVRLTVTAVGLADSAWPKFHQNDRNTAIGTAKGARGKLLWKLPPGYSIQGPPTIGEDGTIYYGSHVDKSLHAVSRLGVEKWKFQVGNNIMSSPAIGADGTLFFTCTDSMLYAVDSSGKLEWSYGTEGSNSASPALGGDGAIYFGSSDHRFYALNRDGTLRWSLSAGGVMNASPAIGEHGMLYFASGDKKVYAVSSAGVIVWKCTLGDGGGQIAIGSQGMIYCAAGDHGSSTLDAITPQGVLAFQISCPKPKVFRTGPSLGPDSTIYMSSWDGILFAYTNTGKLKWSFKMENMGEGPSVGLDGTLYFVTNDGLLYSINPNGTLNWKFKGLGNVGYAAPVIGADGTVYFSDNLYLYAIK